MPKQRKPIGIPRHCFEVSILGVNVMRVFRSAETSLYEALVDFESQPKEKPENERKSRSSRSSGSGRINNIC